MNRQTVMLSAFPHWDPRIGHGQRSAQDQWSAVVFLNKKTVLVGDQDEHLKARPIYVAGGSGTMIVAGHGLPHHIEKVIARARAVFGHGAAQTTLSGAGLSQGSSGGNAAGTGGEGGARSAGRSGGNPCGGRRRS